MMSYSTLLLLSCFVPVLFLSGSVRGNSTTEYDQCDPNAPKEPCSTGGIILPMRGNSTTEYDQCDPNAPKEPCSTGGIILPRWGTDGEEISTATMILRATIYFLGLCYMFLGVSQIADLFMEAIEVITSTTSVRVVKTSSGEYKEVEVQVWNETVANLTLMALGSSAPEILLSVIEICGNNFKAGDLGPGTIVGSAAFNLFVITALCVSVIPDGTGKSVKNFGVFACTASWSIGAYVWLYLMIAVITKEKVDWWEGLITLLLFGAFILMSYTIDRKNEACALGFRYVGIYDPEGDGEGGDTAVVTANGEGSEKLPLNDVENGMAADNSRATDGPSQAALTLSKMVQQKMSTKEKIMARLKEIADKNPSEPDSWLNKVDSELSQIIFYGKSRAYFRIHKVDVKNQTEKYRKFLREAVSNLSEIKKDSATRNVVFCADTKVKFAESCGTGKVVIERAGPFLETSTTKLQYAVVESETAKNAATAKKDFEPSNGWLEFAPGETQKTVDVVIYDDPEFEEDEEFVVKLFDIQETTSDVPKAYVDPKIQREIITCVIIDDDHHGRFRFTETTHSAKIPSANSSEAERIYKVEVERTKGCRGVVRVPYEIIPSENCVGGKNFTIAGKPELIFQEKQYKALIEVEVLPCEDLSSDNMSFKLILKDPEVIEDASDIPEAKPEVLEDKECTVTLVPSLAPQQYEELKEKAETSWKKKITDSLTMQTEGDPGVLDYIIHYLQMPFTIMFCLVPPPGLLGGWAAFVVAIIFIGGMTAVIGDLASAFGCTVGLKDAVTAITLVALGTSLPDTFASKVAAVNDKFADSSVGNVTGSNAVNVFLGVGVAWFTAAVYHEVKGTEGGFVVCEGSLGLSVTVFVVEAIVCIAVLILRRVLLGSELGGPKVPKYITSSFFVTLWLTYIIISVLNAYDVIESPF